MLQFCVEWGPAELLTDSTHRSLVCSCAHEPLPCETHVWAELGMSEGILMQTVALVAPDGNLALCIGLIAELQA